MEKLRITPKISREDVESLTTSHGTNERTIRELLQSGINPDDIDEVLDIRDSLSGMGGGNPWDNHTFQDTVSVKAVVNAYKASGRNMDIFKNIADLAFGFVGSYDDIKYGSLTAALNKATRAYQARGESIFNE